MLQELKQKIKEIFYGTPEWEKAVKECAEYLDEIDQFFWKVAEIAIRIPLETGGRTSEKTGKTFSGLTQFAMEVQKQTKHYKNFTSCYERIKQARRLREEYEPEEIHEDLSIDHHKIADAITPNKEAREKLLKEAEEKDMSAREMAESYMEKHNLPPEQKIYTYRKWYGDTTDWCVQGMEYFQFRMLKEMEEDDKKELLRLLEKTDDKIVSFIERLK